jgi:hypothetical protein
MTGPAEQLHIVLVEQSAAALQLDDMIAEASPGSAHAVSRAIGRIEVN